MKTYFRSLMTINFIEQPSVNSKKETYCVVATTSISDQKTFLLFADWSKVARAQLQRQIEFATKRGRKTRWSLGLENVSMICKAVPHRLCRTAESHCLKGFMKYFDILPGPGEMFARIQLLSSLK